MPAAEHDHRAGSDYSPSALLSSSPVPRPARATPSLSHAPRGGAVSSLSLHPRAARHAGTERG